MQDFLKLLGIATQFEKSKYLKKDLYDNILFCFCVYYVPVPVYLQFYVSVCL